MLVIVAVLLTLAVYHTLFQLQGYNYSVSSIRDLADWPLDVARRLGVSLVMGGMVTLIFLMFMNENNWRIILNTGYGYGILVTFVFALPLFWVFWQNGFAVGWRLPAITSTFWQITALFETMIAAGMALLLPWPLLGLATLVAWIRGRLSEAQAPSEPDTFPGLHL